MAVRQFLDAGDDIDEVDADSGDTALIAAVRESAHRALHLLLARGASQRIGDSQGGYMPIHVAAIHGNSAAAAQLISFGAPVSEYHPDGLTALHRAAMGGLPAHRDTMRVLVNLGASPDEPTYQPYDLTERHRQPVDLVTRDDSRAALQAALAEPWRQRDATVWSIPRSPATPALAPGMVIVHRTVVEMTASGEVSDYDDEAKAELGSRFAAVAGVDPSAVAVTVRAASVIITVIITVSDADTATALATTMTDTLNDALEETQLNVEDIDVAHVGNFVSALFTGQAQLNGFFGHVHPALHNITC